MEWFSPKTDATLVGWAGKLKGRVDVICPGFGADCLETLEEINITYREKYAKAGGGEFGYVPCLNASPAHIAHLAELIHRHIRGWDQ